MKRPLKPEDLQSMFLRKYFLPYFLLLCWTLGVVGLYVCVQFTCKTCQACFFQSWCDHCCTASHSSICEIQKLHRTKRKNKGRRQQANYGSSIQYIVSCSYLFMLTFILRQYYGNGKSCQRFLNTADKSCFENLFQDNSAGLVHLPVAEFCRQKQDRALKSYCSAHESC